jgi:GT2 family glycosyltransferase
MINSVKIQEYVTPIAVTYNSISIVDILACNLNQFKEAIVVDNASQDGTLEKLLSLAPHINVICNHKNIGFGAANNIGVKYVKTPFILFVNPDCKVGCDALDSLLRTAEQYPNAGVIAPQSYFINGSAQISYRQAYYERSTTKQYRVPDAVCSAKWLHGCCLLVRLDVYRLINGFDEQFFLFYEEDDLCLKVLAAGFDCIIDPGAKVLHLGGRSTEISSRLEIFKNFHYARSRYLITLKYQGIKSALSYRIKIFLLAPFAIFIFFVLNKRLKFTKWLGWGRFAWSFTISH